MNSEKYIVVRSGRYVDARSWEAMTDAVIAWQRVLEIPEQDTLAEARQYAEAYAEKHQLIRYWK